MNRRGWVVWAAGLWIALSAVPSHAQNSSVLPRHPASGTLTTQPPKPPPPTRPPGPKPDTGTVRRPDATPPGRGDASTPATEPASEPTPSTSSPTAPVAPARGAEAPAPPPIPTAPDRARELLIASADIAQSDAQRAWLGQQGVSVLRRRVLVNLGWVLTVYRVPAGTDLATLLAALQAQWPDAMPEVNERYRPLSARGNGAVNYAAALVGLPERGCAQRLRLAMLDGPVNAALPAFAGRVRSIDIADRSATPDYSHGTGVAALLLGGGESPGLLPDATLLAANVFAQKDGRGFTTTEWILRGLDWVLGEQPAATVVNLSFGGRASAQLERGIARVQSRMRVVAAAGNDGAGEPVFPAAYRGVVAVAAVDALRRHWPGSNTGEFVSVAAPGVDVWTVDGAGRGYYASGTSFAAVFVSAAVALGAPSQAALETWLSTHVADLGAPGRDQLFGFGILRAEGLCKQQR